jgi:hypothetical protein
LARLNEEAAGNEAKFSTSGSSAQPVDTLNQQIINVLSGKETKTGLDGINRLFFLRFCIPAK